MAQKMYSDIILHAKNAILFLGEERCVTSREALISGAGVSLKERVLFAKYPLVGYAKQFSFGSELYCNNYALGM